MSTYCTNCQRLDDELAAKTRECERANAGIDNANQTLREIGLRLSEKVYELLRVANAIEPDKGSLNVEELVASAIQLRVDLAAKTAECDRLKEQVANLKSGAGSEVRPEVRAFALVMEQQLRKHDAIKGSGGWKNDEACALYQTALKEMGELAGEIYVTRPCLSRIVFEAADVANMCMMIADVSGLMYSKADHPGRALLEHVAKLEAENAEMMEAAKRMEAKIDAALSKEPHQ